MELSQKQMFLLQKKSNFLSDKSALQLHGAFRKEEN